MGLDLSLMVINPNSKNQEAALQYIQAYLEEMAPGQQVMLAPAQFTGGVSNPDYDETMAEYLEDINNLETLLAQATSDLEKTQLEEQLRINKEIYGEEKEQLRYLHQAGSVAHYTRLLDTVGYVHQYEGLNMILRSPDFNSLFDRYLAGNLNLNALVSEAEGKLRLMRLESE